jgi:hypothetical protein
VRMRWTVNVRPGVSRAIERVVGVLMRRSGGGERRLFAHSAIGVAGVVRGYVRGIWWSQVLSLEGLTPCFGLKYRVDRSRRCWMLMWGFGCPGYTWSRQYGYLFNSMQSLVIFLASWLCLNSLTRIFRNSTVTILFLAYLGVE